MSDCPKCHERIGLVPAEIVRVGALLEHKRCGAVLIVTDVPPGPGDFGMRIASAQELAAGQPR